jgi:hypothetical protein
LAVWALFRGEDSDEARVGGMIMADMAIRIRYTLGGQPIPPDPDEGMR